MMKSKLMILLGLGLILVTGCVRETVIINDPLTTDADLYYEYTADAFGTIVQGGLYNDGETYIEAVELDVRMYDRRGYNVDNELVWVDTYFNPGGSVGFYFDFPQRGIYDVEVYINRYN